MSAKHSRGHVSPTICLSACMSASQSDISISQQWVPETLRHLFLHRQIRCREAEDGREGEGNIWGQKKTKRVRKMRRGSSDGWGGSEWESRICTPDIFGILNEAFGSTDTLTIWRIFQCTAVIFPSQHQCRHETHRSPDRASEQTAVLTTTFSDRTARSQWTEAAFLFKLACLVSCQCVLF